MCVCVEVYVCVSVLKCICMYVSVLKCICTYVRMCVCVECMYLRVYKYIYV